MATIEMQSQLPKLDDDADVGKLREHTVQRDDEPDLKFTGTLKASAAPEFRAQQRWREYRVYETKAGHLVLSRVGRSIKEGERDKFEAHIFKFKPQALIIGNPSYVAAGADKNYANFFVDGKEMKDVLTEYFGFDELAKELYRKLGVSTEQTID